jgi:hypothetical protein
MHKNHRAIEGAVHISGPLKVVLDRAWAAFEIRTLLEACHDRDELLARRIHGWKLASYMERP